MPEYDIVIVGGGPAGMAAGIYGARAGLSTIILEELAAGGTAANSPLIENYPGFKDANEYFTIKPKDHIDAVCRDHDICWIKYGDHDGKCNEELFDRVFYLDQMFSRNNMHECANVAGDIGGGFLTIFVVDKYPDSPGSGAGAKVGKVVTEPVLYLVGYPMHKLLISIYGYPDRNQKCNLPVNVDSDR